MFNVPIFAGPNLITCQQLAAINYLFSSKKCLPLDDDDEEDDDDDDNVSIELVKGICPSRVNSLLF